jgi:excinuclease ABC subunit A
MKPDTIRIQGARQHNLKGLDVAIPLNRITAVTGVSGSGKSSLAFDTLYAEGQRRYVETFSPYARQFMDRMDRPRVEQIERIPPAIAIDRKDPVRTSRSTVGTMTEITDFVKLLFGRAAVLHCRECGRPLSPATPAAVGEFCRAVPSGLTVLISFPLPVGQAAGSATWAQLGFDRWFDGTAIRPLADLPRNPEDTVHVLVDRLKWRGQERQRIIESAEQAFRFGNGRLDLWAPPDHHAAFSSSLACAACGISYSPPPPGLFSFNSPVGACPTCRGFGRVIDIDPDLIVPDPSLSIAQGAIKPWGGRAAHRAEYDDLVAFCREQGIPVDTAFAHLTAAQRTAIFEGRPGGFYGLRGFFKWLEGKTYKMHVRVFLSRYRSYNRCPDCRGSRFQPEALLYRLGGVTIAALYALNVRDALAFFEKLAADPQHPLDEAAAMVANEVLKRLQYLRDVGLDYLTLERQSRSLSGGEVQRVALASALGASLVHTLYVLDEPSIGLHPRDSRRLVTLLEHLRDQPNTVVVVEHDPEIIARADYLLDIGPGAGDQGGEIVYFGPTADVHDSLTGEYLTGERRIPLPARRRRPRPDGLLTISGAAEHNLRNLDVAIPLGLLVCLTGVSGSGKSTLVEEILFKGLKWIQNDPQGRPGRHRAISGAEGLAEVVLVDQRAIGRTPRANALTYTKAMEPIRRLLAETPHARAAGYGPGHFSFNVGAGRCETCRGEGFERVEMQFLSDVTITCPDCGGKRFKPAILAVAFRGRNIDDILNMTVDAALEFFSDQAAVVGALTPLGEVGLGYIRLGQPINTLSGGEAQRLKLARHLKTGGSRPALFVFDEPTTGLHFEDIGRLLQALQRLVAEGHSVLVVEHNLDVVKTADWVIDLGPEGGDAGGRLVVAGTPETVADHRGSHTGRYLKAYLAGGSFPQPAAGLPMAAEAPAAYGASRPRDVIAVRGAREHNLKNVQVDIPHNQLVVLTGVSGSGKSTLAFDILYAEGQRRYLESLAPYVRQYMKILERPDVDVLDGLPPTVAIEQRVSHAGRRSTVATLTEIYHFLRLLFSKLGERHCPGCGRQLIAQSRERLAARARERFQDTTAVVLAPKVAGRKGFHRDLLATACKQGYEAARIDGTLAALKPGMALNRHGLHTIELVVGRLPHPAPEDLIFRALEEGGGAVILLGEDGREEILSLKGVCPACGIGLNALDPRLFSFNSPQGQCPACEGLGQTTADPGAGREAAEQPGCPACGGSRLKPEALAVKIQGHSIWDLVRLPAGAAAAALAALKFVPDAAPISAPILAEIGVRLALLNRLGLGYLSLGRSGETLSGGEAQRVRLAAQLGSNLTGVCYILDEPTIGLHPRDSAVLIAALKELRDRGNSILVVEHDEETIRAADTLIDLGPGAGRLGGAIVATGPPAAVAAVAESVTGAHLRQRRRPLTSRRRPVRGVAAIGIRGASAHNLQAVDVDIPLATLVCVTGVSGSGKSSLLKETLYKGLRLLLNRGQLPGHCRDLTGWRQITRVLEVDHSPIGRTPRSVPASYVGFLNLIRDLLAATPLARSRGYRPGRFSFNRAEGYCPACKGHGSLKTSMSFLPDVTVHCEICDGRRFTPETLEVRYKGRNMAEILEMTFAEAADFFAPVPKIRQAVKVVDDIGLGYLRLGQPSPTLSGGEAQRIKLAEQLARPGNGHTLYILDEPTTGLQRADVLKLTGVLQALVDAGNTVAVIEHNLEIMKAADWIIDLGPEGGDGGGRVVAAGAPEEILAAASVSHTARCLQRDLAPEGGRSAAFP